MRSLISLVPVLAFLDNVVVASCIPRQLGADGTTPRDLSNIQVQKDLSSMLSSTTTIIGPTESKFNESTERWELYSAPKVEMVIQPGQETDVALIVQYCASKGIDFLVYNGGHGSTKTLGDFNGIQISMTNLRNVTIEPDTETAWIQGGALAADVIPPLWDRGYVTPTGATSCVGYFGLGLGGGHGPLEGFYGMVSDNYVQLNMVLANGTAITVNETNHSNLFWGMKGAGHNFGIVTSAQVKIYPRGPESWHYKAYTWRGDKLEAIFDALNKLHGNGTTPVNMAVNYGTFLMIPTITKEEPVIFWSFEYRGSAEEANVLLAPFDAIEAVAVSAKDSSYPELSIDPDICKGAVRLITTAGLEVYNVTTERQIFDSFTRRVNNTGLTSAIIIHEGYSTEAVQKIDPASSAYPFRGDHHLMQFQGNLVDTSLEGEMWQWAQEVRDLWNAGQPGRAPNAYTNYANGFEPKEEWYGHEPWRMAKLRDLKTQYDAANRFRFYNPIL